MSNIARIEVLLSGLEPLVNGNLEQRDQPSFYRSGIGSSLMWSAGMGLFNALKVQREVYDQYASLITIKKELDEVLPVVARADQNVSFREEMVAWAKGYEVSADRTPTGEDLLTLALSDNPPPALVADEDDLARKAAKLGMSAEKLGAVVGAARQSEAARRKAQVEGARSFAARDYDGLRRQLDVALERAFCSEKFEVTFEQAAAITRKLLTKFKQYHRASVLAVGEAIIEDEEDVHAVNVRILGGLIKDASALLKAFENREQSETSSMFEPADMDRDEPAAGRDKDSLHAGAQLSPSEFAKLREKFEA